MKEKDWYAELDAECGEHPVSVKVRERLDGREHRNRDALILDLIRNLSQVSEVKEILLHLEEEIDARASERERVFFNLGVEEGLNIAREALSGTFTVGFDLTPEVREAVTGIVIDFTKAGLSMVQRSQVLASVLLHPGTFECHL